MSVVARVELQPAYVLHRRPYRETSLIVEILAESAGRVGLVARGVRGPRSRQRGLVEPFVPLLASWTLRGELGTLTHLEPAGPARMPAPAAVLTGLYLNELLLRLLQRGDPHPGLFGAYAAALHGLVTGAPWEPVLRVFEKHLLQAIGYGLVLDREVVSGANVVAEKRYSYLPDQGPVEGSEADFPAGVPISGRTLMALAREELAEPVVLNEAKRLMRVVLAEHLGPRPLRSRELFEGARRR